MDRPASGSNESGGNESVCLGSSLRAAGRSRRRPRRIARPPGSARQLHGQADGRRSDIHRESERQDGSAIRGDGGGFAEAARFQSSSDGVDEGSFGCNAGGSRERSIGNSRQRGRAWRRRGSKSEYRDERIEYRARRRPQRRSRTSIASHSTLRSSQKGSGGSGRETAKSQVAGSVAAQKAARRRWV